MQMLAVVYFPKIQINGIDEFRKKYDPQWRVIAPHVTVVSPVSQISEGKLVEHIERVTKGLSSFSIRLRGLMKTDDDCLFLLVEEGNEEIISLHDALYSGILCPYLATDFPFVPHVTLGFFRTQDDRFDERLYAKAFAEARGLPVDIRCEFDALSVIKGDGVSPAKIVKRISLMKKE